MKPRLGKVVYSEMHVVGGSGLLNQKVYLNPEKEPEIGAKMGSNMMLNRIDHAYIFLVITTIMMVICYDENNVDKDDKRDCIGNIDSNTLTI